MNFELNLPNGDKQRLFRNHFNALLRTTSQFLSGEAQANADGTFESSATVSFEVDNENIALKWTLHLTHDGTLTFIDVQSVDFRISERLWEIIANRFFERVLSAAFLDKKMRYFYRHTYCYMGVQLDGEYWFPEFRLAPAIPNDPQPLLLNAERILFFDMNIDALDGYVAASLGEERAQRYAARLSFLLNFGLYSLQHGHHRWVIAGGMLICE